MSGQEYLKQIKKLETQIRNKSVEEKRAIEIGVSAGNIESEKRELNKQRCEIIRSIEQLPEAEYDVLHKVYVQYETLQEVAADRDISYSLAATIHGRALKRLEDLINK